MQKDLLLPASILAGCTVIAVGLYLGLSSRAPASGQAMPGPALSAAPSPAAPGAPGAGPSTAPSPSPAPGQPAPGVQAATEAAAREALLAQKRDLFLPKCWEPALKKAPEPARMKLTFDMTFNAEGREIGRGIHEDRSALRPEVANCIRAITEQLQLSSPPGVPVRVNLPLELP